jgi:TolB-like protein
MKRKMVLYFLLAFLITFLSSSSGWPGEVVTKETKLWAQKALAEEKALAAITAPNTLAVLYFQNKSGNSALDPLRKGLTLMLITDLSQVKGLQVIERVKLQALVEEMGLGASGLVDEGTAPRVGRLLGARWLVGGNILPAIEERLKIQANPLDVPKGQVLGEPLREGKLADLFRLEKELLFEIIKLLKIEVSPEEERAMRRLCTAHIKAFGELVRGIEASDRGEYEKAASHYEKALQEDPQICIARGALQELKNLGLIKVTKRSQEMLRTLRERTSTTDQLTQDEITRRTRTPQQVPAPVKIDIYFP